MYKKNVLILNTPVFLGGEIDLKLIITQNTPVCISRCDVWCFF